MKISLTIQIVFIIALSTFAQTEVVSTKFQPNGLEFDLTFNQEPYSQRKSENRTLIRYFNSMDESIPGTPILPSETYFVAIPPLSKVKISLVEQKYNFIKNSEVAFNPTVYLSDDSSLGYKESKPDLSKFVTAQFPVTEFEVIDYTWLRDYYCAVIKINTHTYNWKKKEIRELLSTKLNIKFVEVTSFSHSETPLGEFDKILKDIIINYQSASQFRSIRSQFNPVDSSGNWIDYSLEYVKLQIPDDGIYRIGYNDIVEYGINPQIVNPKTFKIFSKGNELPIYVSGENDLSFDPEDYIEFWSERNYETGDYRNIVSPGEDYINYFNRYSDTSIVWLGWDGNEGKRVNIQNVAIPGLTDTLFSHYADLHFEEDERLWYYDAVVPRVQLPFWQENKVWTYYVLGNGGNIPIGFSAPNYVPNTPVNITARLISNSTDSFYTNNHRFGLSVNSTSPQDTIVFSYKETVNFSAEYNSNQLVQGNNIVRIFGMQNDSLRWHQALIDWLDVEYVRNNVAYNDSLLLRINDPLENVGSVIKISNITQPPENILVYKIKPFLKKITLFNILNSVLTFTDTVSLKDEYIVVKEDLLRQPVFKSKKYFINLRDNSRGTDYLEISNRLLQASAEDYLNFIDNNYNLRNALVFVDDIYDEFAFGYSKPEAIRDFLEYANENWIQPAPSFLLLLGDANYDYKEKLTPSPTVKRKNLVPSYGNPVSDSWFTMWDSTNVNLPQMFVGRVSAESNEEVYKYLEKHQLYLNRKFDDFNKRYLFFSGGDPATPNQIELLKSTNDFLLNNFVKPAPVGGQSHHFYKTVDPPTNFGPFTREQIDNAIDSSGLFISYIGHSGTETWDNGITDVTDLQNSFNDRLPLITDFGCSTGKFAEPDIDAFSELFISASPDGQAIAYLGNSSWGYVSTSITYPKLFYEQLLLDSAQVISKAHLLAKMKLLDQYGTGDVNRVFNYCNILFGDPLIGFGLPPKPNLSITNSSISLVNDFPLDTDDSTQISIELINFGEVLGDSVLITIKDNYSGNQNFLLEFAIPLPLYKKLISINIPISGLVGQHNIEVEVDKNNTIDEIYENDNSADFIFVVYSTSVRAIEPERFYNSARVNIDFLNPVFLIDNDITTFILDIADNPDFNNSFETDITMDTLFTRYNLPSLEINKRYWLKARLNLPQSVWSKSNSLFNEDIGYDWYFNNSFNYPDLQINNVIFDSTDNNWKLTKDENVLEISSAGGDDGEFGSIKVNNFERLPNTYYWGIATAIIDSITLEPSDFKYFLFWDPNPADSLISYIDSLTQGTMLAMTICSDGAQAVLGYVSGTPVRQAIETLGSLYVDSVFYRDSWCMIGKKGAPQGTVPESFSKRFTGPAELDTSIVVSNQNGWIEFPVIKNSAKWLNVTKLDSLPTGSEISYTPIGIKSDNSIDTLDVLTFSGNVGQLNNINADDYPYLQIFASLKANENFETPLLKTLGVNFVPVPELGTNYQVVSTTADSVTIGEEIGLSFYVYNVGESKADSFNVKVEVINEDNSRQTIYSQRIDSLASNDRKIFNINFNTSQGSGAKSFLINIDSDNEIRELFEDNNFFSIPFYVQDDTTTPTINLTFDGYDIVDGDFISSTPEIQIELNDESLLPLTDPSSVLVYLNDDLIPSDTSIINYTFSNENPKVKVDFNPILSDGEYTLKILWKDSQGNIVDSSGVEKYFQVSGEAQLLYVYNYPNPTSGVTYFTFKLTQIPDNIQIKIYTIAGRLIKDIDLNASDLRFDFNKIYWDGRDEDGDPIANGVYIYKVIMQAGEKSQDVTQKLAIVK